MSARGMVSLDEFIGACRACVHETEQHLVVPDAFVWRDLRISGDDWWVFSVNLLEQLNAEFDESKANWNIYDYIPDEGETGLFGRYIGAFTKPDIRLREVYAFIRDGLKERAHAG